MAKKVETAPSEISSIEYQIISPTTLALTSAGSLALGGVIGIYSVFRFEKTRFDKQVHGRPLAVAFKALTVATFLTFGTFGLGIYAFQKSTGIRSVSDFGFHARKFVAKYNIKPVPTAAENEAALKLDNDAMKEVNKYLGDLFSSDENK